MSGRVDESEGSRRMEREGARSPDPNPREVVRLRLGLPAEPVLASLQSVGRAMDWIGSMRASQVQVAAFERFERSARARLDAGATVSTRKAEAQDALDRLEKATDEVRQAADAVGAASSTDGGRVSVPDGHFRSTADSPEM